MQLGSSDRQRVAAGIELSHVIGILIDGGEAEHDEDSAHLLVEVDPERALRTLDDLTAGVSDPGLVSRVDVARVRLLAKAPTLWSGGTRPSGARRRRAHLTRRLRDRFRSPGHVAWHSNLAAELAAAGAKPRRLAATGVDALTPSERRVAQLAAEGLSNREIAHELFITMRTVTTSP